MSYRTSMTSLLAVALLLCGGGVLWAQTPPPPPPVPPPQDLESLVRPDTVAARKAAVQARLEALSQSNLPQADLEASRGGLAQMLKVLTALEEAFQKRAAYMAHTEALSQRLRALEAERQTLEAQPARRLEQTANPTEAMRLEVHLAIIEIRQGTAHYQQQRSRLGDEVLAQEKRNAQEKQDLDRLVPLVEKYASGEGVAQRLAVAFERLQHERARYRDTPMKTLEARLRTLTSQMLALDDRLFEFDDKADARLARLTTALQHVAPTQRDVDMATIRKVLDEQKAALREQPQELTALTQEVMKLLALHREHKRLLDDGYHFVRTQMFWLRNAATGGWTVGRDMGRSAVTTIRRLHAFASAEQARLRMSLLGTPPLWLPVLLLVLVLPWVAYRVRQRLQHLVVSSLATQAQRQTPPSATVAVLLGLRSAVWPAVIAALAWARGHLFPETAIQDDLAPALVSSLQVSALVLWIGLLGRALLRQDGWGQRFWELDAALCRFLRRVMTLGCLAAFVFLVPRHVLLSAPGEAAVATGSLALARVLFLAFQGVMLVLVGLVGRRGSPLMEVVLARSRQGHGLWWRTWPLVYVALLGGVVAIMALDLLGYGYAAQYLWSRVLQSLLVLLILQLLVRILALRALQRLLGYVFSLGERLSPQPPAARPETARRVTTVVSTVCNTLSALLTVGIILEIWGVSAASLLTSPLGLQVLRRALVMALAIGLIVGVVQVSNALTEYLLQPKTDGWRSTRQVGRKLRTLVPLIQTLIRVLVIFVGVLIILEQLGVATAPLIAGVGIFGLAVGFASQSLIKDVINGLFILFEDSLSVGDVVVLRGTGGLVEKVTLRAVGDELQREPEYSKDLLAPLEIMGLDRFADSAVIIRARLKTRPLQQWRIGREMNRRIKKTFDARGIEIPFPHRTLYWGVAKAGVQPDSNAPADVTAQRVDAQTWRGGA